MGIFSFIFAKKEKSGKNPPSRQVKMTGSSTAPRTSNMVGSRSAAGDYDHHVADSGFSCSDSGTRTSHSCASDGGGGGGGDGGGGGGSD